MTEAVTERAERAFSAADQRWFADVSGDHNPLHVDEVSARRLLFGRPAVHGVHVALWALDAFLDGDPRAVQRIAVNFQKPVFPGESITLVVVSCDAETAHLRVARDGSALTTVRLTFAENPAAVAVDDRVELSPPRVPQSPTLAELEARAGSIPVPADDGRLRDAFPCATSLLGEPAVAQLCALSRLVGMECPGLHSLFGGFDVSLDPSGSASRLDWEVMRVQVRFSALRMKVSGGWLRGTVNAFMRPRPVRQASAGELAAVVRRGEFQGMRALVVGGSRGIGELTAKLVAAGGGEALVTWHRGEEEARGVVGDIRAAGGRASALHLDVGSPEHALAQLADQQQLPTHLYYFASPRIFVRRTRLFDPALLQHFVEPYVTGFTRVLQACRDAGVEELVAFYPSSVAVGESLKELAEYAAAKAAGEVAARLLGDTEPWLRVVVERLPRLPTDQTATLQPVDAADPVTVLLDVVRKASLA